MPEKPDEAIVPDERSFDDARRHAVGLSQYAAELHSDLGADMANVIDEFDGLMGDLEAFLNQIREALGFKQKDYDKAPFRDF